MRVCPSCYGLYAPDQDACPKDGTATVDHSEVLIGLNLGPYVVRSLVSEGGMGVVYVGEHPTLGRRVALKVLRPELSLRDDIVERFTQEARAVNTIGHANIVNIYDFGKTPFGTFYIVMEFLDGRTLRQLIDQAGPQPLARVRHVVDGVGTALAAAHAKGFVHRDVKPENVMIGQRSGTEYVKLLDFGIAKLLTAGTATATGSAMGTPQYMSPEQLEDADLDHRTDIYALGAVVFELLTGQVPYPGTSHAAVRQAQLTRQPPPPSICRRDIRLSDKVDQAVLRAIALNPHERFQQLDEFVEVFHRGYADTLARRVSGGAPAPSPRRWPLFAGLAMLVAGVAALIAFVLTEQPTKPTTAPGAGTVKPARPPAPLSRQAAREAALERIGEALHGSADARRAALADIELVKPESLRARLLLALDDDDRTIARQAAELLGAMKPEKKTIAALKRRLKGASSYSAVALAAALARLGDAAGLARLKKLLHKARHKRHPLVVRAAVEALAEHGDAAAAAALAKRVRGLSWANDPSELVRTLAKLASNAARREEALAGLRKGLKVAPAGQLLAIAEALVAAGGPAAKAARRTLEGLATEDQTDVVVRVRALALLARLGDPERGKSLLELLRSGGVRAQRRCAVELGRLRRLGVKLPEATADLLAKAMRNPDDGVKLAAAVALLVF